MFLLFIDNCEGDLKYYFYSELQNCLDNLNSIFNKYRVSSCQLNINFKPIYLDSDTKNETDKTLNITYHFSEFIDDEALLINTEKYDYIPNNFTLEFLNEIFSKHNFSVDTEPILW